MATQHSQVSAFHCVNNGFVIRKDEMMKPLFFFPFSTTLCNRRLPLLVASSSLSQESDAAEKKGDDIANNTATTDDDFLFFASSKSLPGRNFKSSKELAVKRAFARAKSYKETRQSNTGVKIVEDSNKNDSSTSRHVSEVGGDETQEFKLPDAQFTFTSFSNSSENSPVAKIPAESQSVNLAFAKARAYKEWKQLKRSAVIMDSEDDDDDDGSTNGRSLSSYDSEDGSGGVNDGEKSKLEYKNDKDVKEKRFQSGIDDTFDSESMKKDVNLKELQISRIDFMGCDKKSKDLPEVELIVGDTKNSKMSCVQERDDHEYGDLALYQPKVSTWGVFPRPKNISKTFGGGRVIRPGDVLQTSKNKSLVEARTRQSLSAYKTKIGLNINPLLNSECEEALKDGDLLMDLGNLRDALPFYEHVFEKLTFQNDLHGLAALHWSICQDSFNRSDDARSMYRRLLSHPNLSVKKKAKQFMFTFEAMEKMNVEGSLLSSQNSKTGFEDYFEAFHERKTSYYVTTGEVEEDTLTQTLLYVIIFLVCPLVMMILFVLKKVFLV